MPKMHDDWKSAKEMFEKLTKKHKPAKSFLGFFHESTNIDKYLNECDTLADAAAIDLVKLKAAMVKLKSASDAYLKDLKAEKALETGGSKDIITEYSKGISSLRQGLKKYEAYFETKLKEAEVLAGAGNARQKMIDSTLLTYKTNVKSALSNAKAAAARLQVVAIKIASDDSKLPLAVTIYNKEICAQEAARKLTTALWAYGNIASMGGDVSTLKDPKAHIDSLKDYSSRTEVAPNIDPRNLIRIITEFEKKVKAIGQDYK